MHFLGKKMKRKPLNCFGKSAYLCLCHELWWRNHSRHSQNCTSLWHHEQIFALQTPQLTPTALLKVFQAWATMRSYLCSTGLTFGGFTLPDKERANFVPRRQQQPFSIFSAQSSKIPPGRQKRQNHGLKRKNSF